MPIEARMVKKFKRPGAGDGDQLPSDLRPPHVLKTTCDYLFRDLLTNAPSLASVHGFIWDRTRAIRNDFSIQQVTKLEDVRIAIECFERIARFHILALHQMATPESQQQARKGEITYDPQQEREQLDRTLLSLMQYYDDYRGRLDLINEAEFRSYCVIFQLDSSQTDTEDRVQTWPKAILGDRKIQAAMQLFACACTTFRRLGPFKALAAEHVVARQDWECFWKLLNSTKISYLQACVAEIYFHLLRDMVLRSIVRAMRPSKAVNGKFNPNTEWSMHDLRDLFYFDDDDQLVAFCALYDLEFHQVGDEDYLDVSPVAGRTLQTPTFGKSIQESSWVVEQKRLGRSLAAVIDGMSVQQARGAGMIDESEENEEMMNVAEDQEAGGSGEEDPESLFIPEVQIKETQAARGTDASTAAGFMSASPFGEPSFGQSKPSAFGQPSGGNSSGKPSAFGQPTPSIPSFSQPTPAAASEKKPAFSFLTAPAPVSSAETKPATTGISAFPSMTSASLFPSGPIGSSPTTTSPGAASEKPAAQLFASPFGQPAASGAPSLFATKQDSANPFKDTASINPFLAPTAAPATSQEKQTAPLFSFSNSEQTQKAPSLFGDISATAAAAPSISAPEEKPAAPQAPSTAPSQSSPSPSPPSTSHGGQDANTSGSQSPPRRSSINNLPDTKPKKPSPLSHSFTFSEDSSLAGAPHIGPPPTNQHVEELFPGRQKTGLPPSFTQTKPAPQSPAVTQQPAPSFDTVLTRISEELTTDPVSGFLKQYVDYTVKQVITKVQEDLYWERMNSEADEFRSWFLQDKFGKRWRDTCRRQRLAKQGRERRKRAQKRLHESRNSDTLGFGDTHNTTSTFRSSRAGSVASHQSKREMVDAMYKSALGGSRFPGDRQTQAGSKRSVSSQGPDSVLSTAETGHKRMKSTSHVDDRGRVVKREVPGNARSSFLNFALANDAPNRSSTTKSPYFRMKALGIKPAADGDLGLTRGTKRPRSESLDIQQYSHLGSSLLGSSPDRLREGDNGLMRPPSVRSVRSKTNDEDEVLFARIKAAREGLAESESFMRSEVEKESELRHSASSLSDRESPSLVRARAEIRSQASRADSEFGASLSGRKVPAYWLRESRFVPREHYGRARERADELRASRTERPDRPRSVSGQFGLEFDAVDKVDANTSSGVVDPSLAGSTLQTATTNSPNGIFAKSGFASTPAPALQASGPTAGFTGFGASSFGFSALPQTLAAPAPMTNGAPIPFIEDSFTQGSTNPFLEAPVSNGPFISQTQSQAISQPMSQPSQMPSFGVPVNSDHTIQESQIDSALSQSFGQPHADGPSLDAPLPYQPTSLQPSRAAIKTVPSLPAGESLNEDSDESANHLDVNMDEEVGDSDGSQSDASVQFNPNASANRFAMLLDEEDQEESESQGSAAEGDVEQQRNGQDDEEPASDEEETEPQPDSYQYDDGDTIEYESGDGEDFVDENDQGQMTGHGTVDEAVDSDDEGEDAEDEMEYDSEEGSYDEDEEEDGRVYVPQAAFGYTQPQPNEALQYVGNNVEEAIELSD